MGKNKVAKTLIFIALVLILELLVVQIKLFSWFQPLLVVSIFIGIFWKKAMGSIWFELAYLSCISILLGAIRGHESFLFLGVIFLVELLGYFFPSVLAKLIKENYGLVVLVIVLIAGGVSTHQSTLLILFSATSNSIIFHFVSKYLFYLKRGERRYLGSK